MNSLIIWLHCESNPVNTITSSCFLFLKQSRWGIMAEKSDLTQWRRLKDDSEYQGIYTNEVRICNILGRKTLVYLPHPHVSYKKVFSYSLISNENVSRKPHLWWRSTYQQHSSTLHSLQHSKQLNKKGVQPTSLWCLRQNTKNKAWSDSRAAQTSFEGTDPVSKLSVLGLSVKCELVLWFAVRNLVNPKPLHSCLQEAGHVFLHVINVTQLGSQGVIDINGNQLPVCLPLINESDGSQNLPEQTWGNASSVMHTRKICYHHSQA